MLLALLKEASTAPTTIATLHQSIASLLDYNQKKYQGAWPAAECLLAADVFDDQLLPSVLVRGGLLDNENHDHISRVIQRGVAQNTKFAKAVEEELWMAIEDEKLSWGVARMLLGVFRPQTEQAIKDDIDHRHAVLRALVDEATENTHAATLLNEVANDQELRTQLRETLVHLLQDKQNDIAFAAACRLVEQLDCEYAMLPFAIVRGGFGNATKSDKAERLLDSVRERPVMALPLRAALYEALLGSDAQTAWRAAVYLMDRGEKHSLGIARGLVYGGLSHGWGRPRANTLGRIRSLLLDPVTRGATVDALIAALLSQKERYDFNFEAASLLVSAGVDITEVLAFAAEERIRWLAAPFLALVAMSGHINEAIITAKRLGSHELLKILEGPPAGKNRTI
jgi:hypothetical protein